MTNNQITLNKFKNTMLVQEKSAVIKTLKESTSDTCLVCIPYAGANWTAFVPIVKQLDMDINIVSINPPGFPGDSRPVLQSIDEMADLYLKELEPFLTKNTILWGYSMGGLVVHCMLGKNQIKEWNNVTAIISASVPPHLISDAQKISSLSNDDVIHFFHSIGGIPSVILQEKELLDIFLPFLKSDYKAFENYSTRKNKFNIPGYLIYGSEDNFISKDDFFQWKDYFITPPEMYTIDGGHLFIKENPRALASVIQEIINTTRLNLR